MRLQSEAVTESSRRKRPKHVPAKREEGTSTTGPPKSGRHTHSLWRLRQETLVLAASFPRTPYSRSIHEITSACVRTFPVRIADMSSRVRTTWKGLRIITASFWPAILMKNGTDALLRW